MAFHHSWQAVFKPGKSDGYFLSDHPVAFNPHAKRFSPGNAWWFSELSRLIYKRDHTEGYQSKRSRNDYLKRVGLFERHFWFRPNLQASLVETSGNAHAPFAALVFRGTAGPLKNWLVNLNAIPCNWPAGGRVHRGFSRLITVLWKEVDSVLSQVQNPLFFTGHSMGGAMATLAASIRNPKAVYTFGAPRTGDVAFANSLAHVPVFNVFNSQDIVTGLPPGGRLLGFTHAGEEIINPCQPASHRFLMDAPAFLAGHAPLNYSSHLPLAFDN